MNNYHTQHPISDRIERVLRMLTVVIIAAAPIYTIGTLGAFI